MLVCRSVTKRYSSPSGVIEAVADLDLALSPGESLVVVGPNGAGKSTLLRLIAGITAPSSGRVERTHRTTGLIELGAGFAPDLTGRENLNITLAILGLGPGERRRTEADVIEFSGLGDSIGRPVKQYSAGMVARLALASALHSRPALLLVDEVLTVGDASFQRKSLRTMRELVENGCALVMVTHQMSLARYASDWILWLESGRERMRGDSRAVIAEYERHYERGSRSEAMDHTEVLTVTLDPDRIEPGDGVTLHAQVATRRPESSIVARIELRPPVGEDDRWMISRHNPTQNMEFNVIGRTVAHDLVTPAADICELLVELPEIPLTPCVIDVAVVLHDGEGRFLDELTAPLTIGSGDSGSNEVPRLLMTVAEQSHKTDQAPVT